MIEIKVNEIINWFHSNYKDKLVCTHTIIGETIEDCFKKVYGMRRSGRHDSARRYDFEDAELEEKFLQWKSRNENIEMYYGSTTVD
jgi:hypothetical protein